MTKGGPRPTLRSRAKSRSAAAPLIEITLQAVCRSEHTSYCTYILCAHVFSRLQLSVQDSNYLLFKYFKIIAFRFVIFQMHLIQSCSASANAALKIARAVSFWPIFNALHASAIISTRDCVKLIS